MPDKHEISEWFMHLQDKICIALTAADENKDLDFSKFQEDNWKREQGGGGRTRTLQNGNIIEKGGVNFSAVHGKLPEKIVSEFKLNSENSGFFATGVSIVIHPKHPFVPIIHMNVRYFEMENGVKWFGGGIDLTPHYVNTDDAGFFHRSLKDCCDNFDPGYYPEFKKWADDYFFIKHRNETRGVGGIFFDRLSADETHTLSDRFEFVKSIGELFAPLYTGLMKKHCTSLYNEQHKNWQLLRRGRYVEFNLVYDRGTKFGLETNGRTESILMSLPPMAAWPYDFLPSVGSEEEKTTAYLKKNIDWID